MASKRGGDDRGDRPLGFLGLFALGLNQVVGIGIFLLPARLATLLPGAAGPACILAVAVVLAPIALTYAQLARVCGVNGGAATYARLAFGRRAEALLLVVSGGGMVIGLGAIASGISDVVVPARTLAARALAAGIVVALGLAASRRVAVSARIWSVFTVAKMAPLGLLVLACIGSLLVRVNVATPSTASLGAVHALLGAPAASLLVVYVFQGFELVPVVSGRSLRWGRHVPAAMLLALLVAALLYVSLQLACVRLLGAGVSTSAAPLVDLARASGGAGLAAIVGAGGLVSALGVAFGQLFVATELLAQRTTRSRAHRVAFIVTLALVWVLVVQRSVGVLLSVVGALSLTLYVVTATALVVLALRQREGLRRRDAATGVAALAVTGAASVWLLGPFATVPFVLIPASLIAWAVVRRSA